jgi:4-oxalocrotonate tautomerase
MPYVNIQIAKDGNTNEQKESLIRGATQLMVDVLGRRPESVFVVIDEVELENWGVGYDSLASRKAKTREERR